MENKKEIKKIKEMVKTICQSCKNYEDAEKAMSLYFTEITDSESPRKEEFNEKYNIIEIAKSRSRQAFVQDLEDGTKLVVDYIYYKKAPNGLLTVFSQMEPWQNTWLQKDIAIFIKE